LLNILRNKRAHIEPRLYSYFLDIMKLENFCLYIILPKFNFAASTDLLIYSDHANSPTSSLSTHTKYLYVGGF